MHEETPVLHAKKRERLGSRYSRRIREQGGMPAVVYGHKQDPISITLDSKQMITFIHNGERVYTLDIEGGESETVLLRDLQYDYLGTNIVHCDLARVDLNERVHVKVRVELVGEPSDLKKARTSITHSTTELELECTVTNLPDEIEVDISGMKIGDVIHASDVTLPLSTMVLLSDPDAVVAHLIQQKAASDSDEASETDGAAAPEVLTEKKDKD